MGPANLLHASAYSSQPVSIMKQKKLHLSDVTEIFVYLIANILCAKSLRKKLVATCRLGNTVLYRIFFFIKLVKAD